MGTVESFSVATFLPLVGDPFQLALTESNFIDLTLVEASEPQPRSGEGAGRSPFSIVFRGPLEPVLPQRIYRLRHDTLGSFELFIVPIGPDEAGMQYEAVFG